MTEAIIFPGQGVVTPNSPVAPSILGAEEDVRFVGGTLSGPPTTGTFEVGDFVVDRSGSMHLCVVAGTPGTWIEPGEKEIAYREDATNVQNVNPNASTPIPGLTATAYLLARPHNVFVGIFQNHTAANAIDIIEIYLDNVFADSIVLRSNPTAAQTLWGSSTVRLPAPSEGQHTIDARIKTNTAGTLTAAGTAVKSKMIVSRA